MQRVRLLRILLPVFLVGFVLVIVLTVRSRPAAPRLPPEVSSDARAHAEGFTFSDLVAGRRRLLVRARVGRLDQRGRFEVEEVERVEIDREGQPPLVLTAARGAGAGPEGKRLMRLEGGVTIHDEETGFDLSIPTVEVDQVAGVVRSIGDVDVVGEFWKGSASAVVYSLTGRPAEITGLEVDGREGARLQADRAVVEPKTRTVTLDGDVEATQGGMVLRAPLVVLVRGGGDRIESATASPSVTGSIKSATSGEGSFTSREARAVWGVDGDIEAVSLSGGARVQHTRGEVTADRIDAQTAEAGGFVIDAVGQVVATGPMKRGIGQVRADTLRASLDPAGAMRDGVATGNVAFSGDGTSGEAAQATFDTLDASGTVKLAGSPQRRARLANDRTRVAADHVTSDLRGVKLVAEGRVESTLLPASRERTTTGTPPMFAASEAVHFVSASLESLNSGAKLTFRGGVRGWQGDRTLSADEVEMIQNGEVLNARGQVVTRMPRATGHATSEADFIQIASQRLSYRGAAHIAEYEGNVRVRQAEGWLEAPKLTAALVEVGRGVREVQAFDGVRFEYRAPGERGTPTTATGEGDRAVYDAAARLLRLFGEKGPATVRNTGPTGGTTAGRVLRYHLDTGALEVESGERDRATIKTPKG